MSIGTTRATSAPPLGRDESTSAAMIQHPATEKLANLLLVVNRVFDVARLIPVVGMPHAHG